MLIKTYILVFLNAKIRKRIKLLTKNFEIYLSLLKKCNLTEKLLLFLFYALMFQFVIYC